MNISDEQIAEMEQAILTLQAIGQAAIDVLEERKRQQTAEAFVPLHDDRVNSAGELLAAAIVYALPHSKCGKLTLGEFTSLANRLWPWHPSWLKVGTKRRDLVKAAALIIAEIERLDRAEIAQSIGAAT